MYLNSLLVILLIAMISFPDDPPGKGPNPATPDELRAEFSSVSCSNEDRLQSVRALFEKMGADPAEITVERVKKIDNLVIRLEGTDSSLAGEKVVIGAHYDKTEKGCGAVDNWTGIVTIANIYRTLKNHPPRRSIIFVAFGEEEKGLLGSKEMVAAMSKEVRASYCAMINVDSLGLASPLVAENMSSRKLVDFAQRLAKEKKLPFGRAPLEGGNSDSSSFALKNIPALTIHGLGNRWKFVLHTSEDMPERVNFEKVHEGYLLTLELLLGVDRSLCGAFR